MSAKPEYPASLFVDRAAFSMDLRISVVCFIRFAAGFSLLPAFGSVAVDRSAERAASRSVISSEHWWFDPYRVHHFFRTME